MLVMNVTKLGCYFSLLGLSLWGEVPWWVLPVLVMYDTAWVVWFPLPWKKKPKPPQGNDGDPELVTLQQMLQMRAMFEKAKETNQ